MKANLENEIRENKEAFDYEIPPFGHFERFEQKLVKQEKRRDIHWWRWIIASSIAAMIAIILLFNFYKNEVLTPVDNSSIQEIVDYYRMQLLEEADKTKAYLSKLDDTARHELSEDIAHITERTFEKDFLKMNLTDEERIDFIIKNYNAQINSLKHIQSILEKVPANKTNL